MRHRVLAIVVTCLVAVGCAGASPQVTAPAAVAKDLDLGGSPSGVVFDFGSVWVGLYDRGTVDRIDPATGTIMKTITVGDPTKLLARARDTHGVPSAVTSGFGSIWAVGADGRLARIDPATNAAMTFDVGVVGEALATGEGAVWITSHDDGAVVRFDPTAGAVTNTITGLGALFGVAVASGSVWVVSKSGHEVLRLDPTRGTVTARIAAERNPDWVTAGAGSVWVTRETPRAVLRIDPATNAVAATIPGEASWGIGTGIAFHDGAVWTGFLVRIDPSTEKVTASFAGKGEQAAVTFGGGSAWVADELRLHQVPLALIR